VLLGDSVEDGIFPWIAMGINASASSTVQAASNYGKDGGVANANCGMGGPGGAPPNGTAPPTTGSGSNAVSSGRSGNGTTNGNVAAASDVAGTGTSGATAIFSTESIFSSESGCGPC